MSDPEGLTPPLQPTLALEVDPRQHGRHHHQAERPGVAPRPLQLGHVLEVHAVDGADQRRRHQRHRQHREDLDDGVLLVVDHAERGFEQERDLGGEIADVIGERLHVAAGRLHAPLEQLLVAALAHDVGQVGQQAVEREHAFARPRGQLALAPDHADGDVEAQLAGALAAPAHEDRLRQLVDLGLDALHPVGLAVDDGLQQAHHHGHAGHAGGVLLLRAGEEDRKGARLRVAHRDETVAGQDESDGCADRRLERRLLLMQHDGRHVVAAALLIEAAGSLDLGHLLARRHRDGERLLGREVLVLGGVQQVDPHNAGGDGRRPFALDQHAIRSFVDGEHRRPPAVSAAVMPDLRGESQAPSSAEKDGAAPVTVLRCHSHPGQSASARATTAQQGRPPRPRRGRRRSQPGCLFPGGGPPSR